MKGSVTPVLTDPIIGSELIFAVKGKTNYMIPIDDLVAAASFTPGIEPEFLSWDKTWRQVDYSMLSGTPALVEDFGDLGDVPDYTSDDALKFIRVNSSYSGLEYATVDLDLSNYVTIDSAQTITGSKTFQNSAGIKISKGAGLSSFWIYPTTTGSANGYITTAGAITSNQVWYFPHDKSGTIALLEDLTSLEKATSTDINTGTDDAKYVTSLSIRNSNIFSAEKVGQFSTLTEKTSITANDAFVVEHASGGAKQLLKWSIIKAHNDNLYYGNVAGQFNATVEKTSLASNDRLIMEDSAASYAKKSFKWSTVRTTLDSIYYGNITAQFYATSEKTTLTGNDRLIIEDSAATYSKKSIKWSLIVSTIGAGGTATTLDGLSDVTITSPATGNVLQYNGSEWVNATVSGTAHDRLHAMTNSLDHSMSSARMIGRITSGTGAPEELTTANVLDFIGVTASAWKNENITKSEIEAKLTGTITSHTHNYDNYQSWSIAVTGVVGTGTVGSGSSVTFEGTGGTSISRSGNTIIINSSTGSGGIPEVSTGINTRYFRGRDASGNAAWFSYSAPTLHDAVSMSGATVSYLTLNASTQAFTIAKIPIADINASGTPSASTYLRGDGTWATPSTGSGTYNWYLEANGDLSPVLIESGNTVTFNGSGATTVTRTGKTITISSTASGTGTVTSIGLTVPTGFTRTPSTITTSGTFTIGYGTGYSLPLTADTAKGVTAYGWGNHADEGYLTEAPDDYVTAITVSDTSSTTRTITLTRRYGGTVSTTFTDMTTSGSGGDGYVSNITWNPSTGILDFTGVGNAFGGEVDLDGRYLTEETLFNAWIAEVVGSNKYYGTNSSGTKGYYTLPTQSYYWNLQVENNTTASIVEGNKVLFEVGTGLLLLYNNNGIGTYTVTYELNASLNNLNDVVITTPDTNQVLRYNGSTWVNSVDTALSWGDHSTFGYLARLQVNGGITLEGTTTNPILKIVSANQANTGQVSIIGDTLGVVLGTDEYSAAAGNHTHTELHSKRHPITSSSDHTASANKVFYSSNSSIITELSLGASNTILTSNGATSAPTFTSFYDFDGYDGTKKALVPLATPLLIGGATETRYLRADGQWSIPVSTGTSMSNPMTTAMDIIIGGTDGIPTRFGKGSANQVLGINSTNDAFEWKTLSSTFTLALTRDVIAGSDQITYLQPAAINNKSGVGTLLDAHEFLVNVINTGLRKVTALEIKTYLDPFNAQGQLLVGDVSGNSSVISPNTSSTVTVLSQASSITSWKIFSFSSLNDVPVAYNSSNSLNIIKVNGGGAGLGYMKVIITDGTNSSGLSLNGTGTELISKLEYESTPKLSVSLNANSKSILDSGTITPGNVNVSTGISPYTLGTYAKKWNYAYLGELISNVVTTTTLQIGSWKFQTSGTSLVFKYGSTTKAELMQDGNMKFFM